jgi:ketosteroid isomerase-like protein
MSQESVEAVRRLFEYGGESQRVLWQGGIPAGHPFLSLWHPECVLEELAEMPDAATYRGREGVARYFAQIPELWDELSYTPSEILDGSAGVVAATDIRGRSKAGVDAELRVYQGFASATA